MFWPLNFTTSEISQLLQKEDITLEQLLEEESILDECRANNTSLIDFLVKESSIKKMLNYALKEINDDLEESKKQRFPKISCEILTCDCPRISNLLVGQSDETQLDNINSPGGYNANLNPDSKSTVNDDQIRDNDYKCVDNSSQENSRINLFSISDLSINAKAADDSTSLSKPERAPSVVYLDTIFEFLDQSAPLNPLLASYFMKIGKALIGRHTSLVLTYLRHRPLFIATLMKHMNVSAIPDFILSLLTESVDDVVQRSVVHRWFYDSGLVSKLLDLLVGGSCDEVLSYASYCLCEMLTNSRSVFAQSELELSSCAQEVQNDFLCLLQMLESPDSIERVLKQMCQHGDCKLLVEVSCEYLQILMDRERITMPQLENTEISSSLNNSGDSPFVDAGNQRDISIRSQHSLMSKRNVVQAVVNHFHDLNSLFRQPPSSLSIKNAQVDQENCRPLTRSLGSSKVYMLQFFESLFDVDDASLNALMCRCGVLEHILDLIPSFPWNTFLHQSVAHIVFSIVNNTMKAASSLIAVLVDDSIKNNVDGESFCADKDSVSMTLNGVGKMLHHLVVDCNLLQRCLLLIDINQKYVDNKEPRRGYMGHITNIINKINNFNNENQNFNNIFKCCTKELEQITLEEWEFFVREKLPAINKITTIQVPNTNEHSFPPLLDEDYPGVGSSLSSNFFHKKDVLNMETDDGNSRGNDDLDTFGPPMKSGGNSEFRSCFQLLNTNKTHFLHPEEEASELGFCSDDFYNMLTDNSSLAHNYKDSPALIKKSLPSPIKLQKEAANLSKNDEEDDDDEEEEEEEDEEDILDSTPVVINQRVHPAGQTAKHIPINQLSTCIPSANPNSLLNSLPVDGVAGSSEESVEDNWDWISQINNSISARNQLSSNAGGADIFSDPFSDLGAASQSDLDQSKVDWANFETMPDCVSNETTNINASTVSPRSAESTSSSGLVTSGSMTL